MNETKEPAKQAETIIWDPTGLGRPRWSCNKCWDAVIWQPYMSHSEFDIALAKFKAEHPAVCEKR